MIHNSDLGFYGYSHYVDESNLDLTSKTGEYNIKYTLPFLQDALGGLVDSELVVIGADSGIGKSQMTNEIAHHNAELGKKVYLFALEGDKYDTVNRCRYKHYIEKIKKENFMGLYVPYREFLINRIPEQGQEYLESIDQEMKRKYQTLKVFSRENDLTIDLFEGHLELIKDDADLIVIDHLHYYDHAKREYEAINDIMKRLKKKQELFRIPIILVSHLRKKDKLRTFPDQEDFHGSSNIVKQADTVIIIAHIEQNDNMESQVKDDVYQTGIRIAKCRSGFPSKVIGVHEYDLESRAYSEQYELVICGNHYIKPMEDRPRWAKRGKTSATDKESESGGFV